MSSTSDDQDTPAASEAAPDSQSGKVPSLPAEPVIRKVPFIAYTLVGIITIYVLVAPSSVSEFLMATMIAGIIFAIGYMSWVELRG